MKLDWPYDICVGCMKRFEVTGKLRRSEAHVILDALGGKLRVTCLCEGCNNLIGTRYEKTLPLAQTYGIEMDRFAALVPSFEKQLRKPGRTYVAQTEHGPLRLQRDRKGGELRVVDTTLPAGRFKDSRDAAFEIRRRLAKQRADPAEVEAVLERFAAGEPVQVGDETFVPHSGELTPVYESGVYLGPDEAYLAAAYLWLACIADRFVYVKELDGVRQALVAEEPTRDGSWKVERLQVPRDSEAWHRIAMTQKKPAVVDLTLFGRWYYRITFSSFNWPSRAFGYRLNLETGEETVRELPFLATKVEADAPD